MDIRVHLLLFVLVLGFLGWMISTIPKENSPVYVTVEKTSTGKPVRIYYNGDITFVPRR